VPGGRRETIVEAAEAIDDESASSTEGCNGATRNGVNVLKMTPAGFEAAGVEAIMAAREDPGAALGP
jgi:hypothetical protein